VSRYGGSFAFIMADLDHFKCVNDTYGHPAGDRVLRAAAAVLTQACRSSDIAARYGGEEFALILPTLQAHEAGVLAERCCREIEQTCVEVGGQSIRVTASFGVADSEGRASPEEMVQETDKALYRAKQAGRNCVEIAVSAVAVKD
jgi:diguanylate cyclase (GGDEF)-like protein